MEFKPEEVARAARLTMGIFDVLDREKCGPAERVKVLSSTLAAVIVSNYPRGSWLQVTDAVLLILIDGFTREDSPQTVAAVEEAIIRAQETQG